MTIKSGGRIAIKATAIETKKISGTPASDRRVSAGALKGNVADGRLAERWVQRKRQGAARACGV